MEMRYRMDGGAATSPLGDLVARSLAETGSWSVSAMRSPGLRMLEQAQTDPQFRALAPMADKAQVLLDRAVVNVGLQRLTVARDIMAAGLVYNLSDPLSVTQLEWQSNNKVGAAQRTMNPNARGENKMPISLPLRLPIYLTTDTFELDIRTLKVSQRIGMPLDTTLAEQCVRAVNEAIEDATINGPTTLDGQPLVDAGYSAYGLLTAPNANTQSLTAAAWNGTTPNGATVFSETEAMIAKLQADLKFGPYRMYLPTAVGNVLDGDYNATNNAQGLTIRERLLKIPTLQDVVTADMMPATKVVLVQMTSDVVDMVVGQPPTVIPWTSLNGFQIYNLIMAIMIPRVRSDYNGNSGICIGTIA